MRTTPIFLLIALLTGTCIHTFGQKVVGGPVTDTLWTVADNPVTVVGNVTIPVGTTLIIGSGVVVQFAAKATITVNGGVRLLGSAQSPVTIGAPTSSASGGAWKGFRVQSGAVFEARHAILSRADVAIDLRPSAVPVSITHTDFAYNNTALYTERPIIFLNNVLTNNDKGIVFDGLVPKDSIRNNRFCNLTTNALNKRTAAVNMTGNCWCTGDSATIQATLQKLNSSSGALNFIPFDANCINGMVFPGDANYDQIVDMTDLFSIGYGYGSTGPARDYPTIDWIGQPAAPWNDTLPIGAGLNRKFADCDGDGVVDSTDAYALLHNFEYTHTAQKPMGTDTVPTLTLDLDTLPYLAGTIVTIPLMLGNNQPILDFHGLAFTVEYDTAMVNMQTMAEPVSIRFDTSWVGIPRVDYMGIQKSLRTRGKLAAGMTRINHQVAAGGGKVADIIVVMSDDVGKKEETKTYTLTISGVTTVNGNLQPVSVAGGTMTIKVSNGTRSDRDLEVAKLSVYPNPASGQVRVTSTQVCKRISLNDLTGREVLAQPMQGMTTTLDLTGIPAGMYLLQAETLSGISSLMLSVQ